MDKREMKWIQIAHTKRLNKTPKGWIVPSQSGKGAYLVYEEDGRTKCNCPDCEMKSATKTED